MSTAAITMAFLMGLTGSLHCAGMCGPIIWVMPFQMLHGVKKWVALGLYHFGRISVYALLGLILFSFKCFFHPEWQRYISVLLGAMLLVVGVTAFIPNNKIKISMPWSAYVRSKLGSLIGNPSLPTLFIAGVLNGFLPCGLVYMALTLSVASASGPQSLLLMYSFGVGTVPMLVMLTILKSKIQMIRSLNVRKFVPVVMFVMGGLFIVRGMNLGVPYLSPQITVEHNEVKASCCHKK